MHLQFGKDPEYVGGGWITFRSEHAHQASGGDVNGLLPLGEADSGRLTRLLKEVSAETQFVVITHSKRIMEAAQALYGVAMQEPGVSRLVSVKIQGDDGGGGELGAKGGAGRGSQTSW